MKLSEDCIIIIGYLIIFYIGFSFGLDISPKPYIEPEINFNHPTSTKVAIKGIASWYDYQLSGAQWSRSHNTCASKRFKRYSMVTVKNLDNGKTVDCYVNDYGPEEWTKREIDLSSHAFSELADLSLGLLNVEVYAKQDTKR